MHRALTLVAATLTVALGLACGHTYDTTTTNAWDDGNLGGAALEVQSPHRGQTYTFGQWTLSWPANDTDIYLWYQGGDPAIEVVAASNGWWQYRSTGSEVTVYSTGDGAEGSLYAHPWESHPAASPVTGTVTWDIPSENGNSHFEIRPDGADITLTDGGRLQINAQSAGWQFHPYGTSNVVTFP